MTGTNSLPLPPSLLAAAGLPVLVVGLLCLWASPASADFRLCNNTSSRVGIALGYKDAEGWTTEGWWNISSRSCETLLRGTLVARFYYIYAIDYDRGGEWSGQAFMCSRDKEFTIRGTEDCLARGYRPDRLFRGRYRRAAGLDGAAHRCQRAAVSSSACPVFPARSARGFRVCPMAARWYAPRRAWPPASSLAPSGNKP